MEFDIVPPSGLTTSCRGIMIEIVGLYLISRFTITQPNCTGYSYISENERSHAEDGAITTDTIRSIRTIFHI